MTKLNRYTFLILPRVIGVFQLFLFIFISGVFAQPPYGGQIVLATTSDPKSFNEVLAKETSTTDVLAKLFEGLTTSDGVTGEVLPHLAESWEVDEEGLNWIFYLRKGVKWFDGELLTADDVVFTFNDLIFNEDVPNSAKDIYTIEGKQFEVIKLDDYTVQFKLPVRFAPFLKSLGQSILPEHILKKSVEEGKFNFTWGIDTPPEDIIGTGPFRLVKYQPGQRLVYVRNKDYWMKDEEGNAFPYVEKLIYLIVQNQDVEVLKFMDGELDVIGLRASDYPLVKPLEEKGNFEVLDIGAAKGSNFIFFNQNRGVHPETKEPFVDPVKLKWFTNVNFRKAVAHAIDKDKIIEIVMNGFGYHQHSSMGPSAGFFFNPDVTKYDYNPERARQILAAEGFIDRNGDGIIEDEDGNAVEFNLYTNAGVTAREKIASIIKADLEQLGMKVNFLTLEFNNIVAKLTSTYAWDAIVLGLTGGEEPHFGKNVWASDGNLHMWYPRQEKPATDWEARIDDIFTQGVQELDPYKRKELYDEHQRIVSDKLPLIYTVLSSRLYAVRNKFGNLNPTSYGGLFYNLEEIYIKTND